MKKIIGVVLKEASKAAYVRNTYYRTEVFEGELMKFKYHLYKWLPKSLIQIEGTEITMPEWLYKKNGLK